MKEQFRDEDRDEQNQTLEAQQVTLFLRVTEQPDHQGTQPSLQARLLCWPLAPSGLPCLAWLIGDCKAEVLETGDGLGVC